jgi:hypothetical protein
MHRCVGSALLVCGVALLLVGEVAAQGTGKSAGTDSVAAKPGGTAASDTDGAATATAAKDAATGGTEAVTDTAGAPSDAAAQPTAPTAADGKGTYTVRLKDLEDRVNRLKEQIFRSKARLSLLAETVLDRKIAGAKAVISFHNEMGGSFWLNKATFLLDGGAILNKVDEDGSLAERNLIELFNGPVMPGEHTLSVVLQYRGNGFGIFSYLKGYSFKVRSSRTFSVSEGKAIDVNVISFEKGSVTTPLEERPAIRYTEGVADFERAASDGARAEDETSAAGGGPGEGTE